MEDRYVFGWRFQFKAWAANSGGACFSTMVQVHALDEPTARKTLEAKGYWDIELVSLDQP